MYFCKNFNKVQNYKKILNNMNNNIKVFEDKVIASKEVAKEIANLIKSKNEKNEKTILGLATGSSPIEIYKELVRLHKEEGLSFKNVITFNLDEYYPMEDEDTHSYHYFMDKHLLSHVDIDRNNIHIPSGKVKKEDVENFCSLYEQQIKDAGGIDFQLLGIGRTGHLGFNEPGSERNSKTRLITLHDITKIDAANDFDGYDNVPKYAVTMGIETIMNARRIVLVAWGKGKADIVKEALTTKISTAVPASILRLHKNASIYLDKDSSSKLDL